MLLFCVPFHPILNFHSELRVLLLGHGAFQQSDTNCQSEYRQGDDADSQCMFRVTHFLAWFDIPTFDMTHDPMGYIYVPLMLCMKSRFEMIK